MKVAGVKVTRQVVHGTRRICIVELQTDADLTGIGIGDVGASATVKRLVADLLMGADPRGVTGIWQQMVDAQSAGRRGKSLSNAVAVLDMALWDLKARTKDEPLWKTLGGKRPRANAHAGGIDPALSDDELSAWQVRMAREHGLRGGVLRAGPDEAGDLRRLGRMRAALAQAAPEPALMVDAGQQWSPQETIRRVRAIEEQFDLTWIEGACRSRDARGLKQVSDAICGAVCVGRGFATSGDFLPHFHRRSADVIQIDIGAVGITGALQIADAAFGYEIPVTLTAVPGNIHAHLAGVMPSFMSMEIVDPVPEGQIYTTDVRIEQGWVVAGDAPGNGLALT